ncbi:uncharacterized protein [Dermacentor andersoni]|uniref:uncharacterized protein isoform X1 n=1 Tax=Dermacentor andersoni TaxID=34620 RepID=UPI002416480C|nr:uncharacterized protein LOC126547956 isoform X1 [Dermacentor andersoni]
MRDRLHLGLHSDRYLGGPVHGHRVPAAAPYDQAALQAHHRARLARGAGDATAHGARHAAGAAPVRQPHLLLPRAVGAARADRLLQHGAHDTPVLLPAARAHLHVHAHRGRRLGEGDSRRSPGRPRPADGCLKTKDDQDDDRLRGRVPPLLAPTEPVHRRVGAVPVHLRLERHRLHVVRLPLAGHEPRLLQPAHLLLDERKVPGGPAGAVPLPAGHTPALLVLRVYLQRQEGGYFQQQCYLTQCPRRRGARLCVPLQMIKMMITVVTVFMLSWLPLNTYILLSDLDPGVNNYEHIRYVYFVIHWLAMSHASYNPLIYCWMNSKFRDGFCQLFRRSQLCWPARLRHRRPPRKESAAEVAALRRCNTYTTYVSVRAVPGSSFRFTKDSTQTNGKTRRYEDSKV